MMRERFTAFGVIALIASAVLVIIGGIVSLKRGPTQEVIEPAPTAVEQSGSLLREETLPPVTTSTHVQIEDTLKRSFQDGSLFRAGAWEVPGRESTSLVLASPTVSGKPEQVVCGQSHAYCAFFLVTPTSSRLLTWGGPLTGLTTVERFPDADHVIIGSAWSFLALTVVEHAELDLNTGTKVPLLTMELDTGYDSAELLVRGKGRAITVAVTGHADGSKIIPQRITVANEETAGGRLDEESIEKLAAIASSSTTSIPPITLIPSDKDLDGVSINLLLFGVPYRLDLEKEMLVEQQVRI